MKKLLMINIIDEIIGYEAVFGCIFFMEYTTQLFYFKQFIFLILSIS